MTNQHPIAPPPELIKQWVSAFYDTPIAPGEFSIDIAIKAAQWGSDQELDACCEWLDDKTIINGSTALRTSRRPKPPSLKNRALQALEEAEHADHPIQLTILNTMAHVLIREALQSIPEP